MNKSAVTITSKDPAVQELLKAMVKLPGVEDITGTKDEHCIICDHRATVVVKVDEINNLESIRKILNAYACGRVKWSLCLDHTSDEGGEMMYTQLTASFDVRKMTLDDIRNELTYKTCILKT